MYYEPYDRKNRSRGARRARQVRGEARARRGRRGFGGWLARRLLRLIALLLALLILAAGVSFALPVWLFYVEPEGANLDLTDGLPASRANILLLGVDELRDNNQRSDTIIIASIGYRTLKLTSVQRDAVVEIPGRGKTKLNAAFAYGGPELVMRTLNTNFDLNIMHYACVDFTSLVELVDAVGGVDINISEAEMGKINEIVYSMRNIFLPLGYSATRLTRHGERVHLDGLQALAYTRIRKLDSDFRRTSRQRTLLHAMVHQLRANLWNPAVLYRLTRALSRSVRTNMSALQLLSLGTKVLVADNIGQMRLPVEKSYTDDGSALHIDDFPANIAAFRTFAYH